MDPCHEQMGPSFQTSRLVLDKDDSGSSFIDGIIEPWDRITKATIFFLAISEYAQGISRTIAGSA
jgi:hypothetical protein